VSPGRAPLLAARGIGKSFGGVAALAGVDFAVQPGEIVALVGENGAGKSTLVKVLAGVHRPDAGELRIDGGAVAFADPAAAQRAGIAWIPQEPSLCDNLTVAGALFLGAELRRGPWLRERAMAAAATDWLLRVGLAVPATARVAALSPGQQQLLAIARALRAAARVLIFDEPTSSLTAADTQRLFAVVRDLRAQGVGIVWITHRLSEVRELADRAVGLRDGRNSGELPRERITHEALVGLMVGRDLAMPPRAPRALGREALVVRGLCTAAHPQHRLDFAVREGEIVGLAGLLGAGRSEVLRALVGADASRGGEIVVGGAALGGHGPAAAAAAGLVLVPEDRARQGLLLDMSVAANLSLPTLAARGRWLDRSYERELAERSRREFAIALRSPAQAAGTLSGGNQQKIVLAKWLAAAPKVLLLDEPTRGVDVPARAEIHARLQALAAGGMAVLFVSSDLEEVLALADRVLVLCAGRLAGELPRERMSEENIMLLATAMEAG
jgi:ribose transport system ATP-binding protein